MQSNSYISKIFLLFVCFLFLKARAQSTQSTVGIHMDSSKQQEPVKKNSKEVDELISFAKTFLGTPYRYAGASPTGFDCSGFINYVFGNFGFELTRTSYGLAELGTTVKLAEIQPGDLLFFRGTNPSSTKVGHVAMVIEVTPEAIKFIHSSTSRGVVIDNFKTSAYYISRFLKAKRLDYGVKN